ncbi:T-cell surface glycoprotein CD8 beta chain [Pyxicephalus adspersus]|uniref:T-cell surface glycoprotein CD8 beta chain n=1 Tax=Pyxicephalus adspersus TaxID=30357 RepID=UPI003B59B513
MKQLGLNQPCNICWFYILVFFCVTDTYANDVTLIQAPGFVLELVNKEIELKCELKGKTTDNLRICWYREIPRNTNLEFLVCGVFGPKESYIFGNATQSRINMKKNNFPLSSIMKIKDVQQSDSGFYYCMVDITQQLTFGSGTLLTVVETLPTTFPIPTRKPPCKCKKPNSPKVPPPVLICSPVIWAPVAGFAVILMIGLYFLVSHTYRVYRRTHMYFRKYSPKQ